MVTPKKVYTDEEKKILLSNPLRLRIAYARDNERAIVIEVRYDPNIERICMFEKMFLDDSEGNFFLLKSHFRQFMFSAKCFRWEQQLTYPDFVDLFTNLISDVPKDEPLIIRVSIKRNGAVSALIESADPVNTMFEGLVDHVALEEFQHDNNKENEERDDPEAASDEPASPESFDDDDEIEGLSNSAYDYDIVCVDTQPTLPCYATTFATSDTRLIDAATERAKERCGIIPPQVEGASGGNLQGEQPDGEHMGDQHPDGMQHKLSEIHIDLTADEELVNAPAEAQLDHQPDVARPAQSADVRRGEPANDQLNKPHDEQLEDAPADTQLKDQSKSAQLDDTELEDEQLDNEESEDEQLDNTESEDEHPDDHMLAEGDPELSEDSSPTHTADPEGVKNPLEGREIYPLMYNPAQEIMSCGQWVIIFYRNGKWFTPHFCSGSRSDPLRMALLTTGMVEEAIILIGGVRQDEAVLLLSASRGIRHARLVGGPPDLLDRYTRKRKRKGNTASNETVEMQKMNAAVAAEKTSTSVNVKRKGREIPFTGVLNFNKKKSK